MTRSKRQWRLRDRYHYWEDGQYGYGHVFRGYDGKIYGSGLNFHGPFDRVKDAKTAVERDYRGARRAR